MWNKHYRNKSSDAFLLPPTHPAPQFYDDDDISIDIDSGDDGNDDDSKDDFTMQYHVVSFHIMPYHISPNLVGCFPLTSSIEGLKPFLTILHHLTHHPIPNGVTIPSGVFSSDIITRWAQTALCQLWSFQYEYNFHQKVMKKGNLEHNTTYFEWDA